MDCCTPEAAALHRLWSLQLQREYAAICFTYRLKLQVPLIRVEPMRGRWGSWERSSRTLCISDALIEQHSWDTVVEVLKHEMAHQLVDETMGGGAPHGAQFKAAAQTLALDPWAARASGALPRTITTWRERATDPATRKLMDRVQKLLSLATSSNAHEACAALHRARTLMETHAMAPEDTEDAPAIVHLTLPFARRRVDRVHSACVELLVEHFGVQAIFGRLYDARALCEMRSVEIFGPPQQVLLAEHVFYFVQQQIDQLARCNRAQLPPGQAGTRSYKLGILSGFGRQLRAQAAPGGTAAPAQAALVRQQGLALRAFEAARYPRLHTTRWGAGRHDAPAYARGVAAGERLSWHVPLRPGNRSAGPPLLRGRSHGRSDLR